MEPGRDYDEVEPIQLKLRAYEVTSKQIYF